MIYEYCMDEGMYRRKDERTNERNCEKRRKVDTTERKKKEVKYRRKDRMGKKEGSKGETRREKLEQEQEEE